MYSNEFGKSDSFPVMADVEGSLMEDMRMQDEEFARVEDLLKSVGEGMSKEMVRVSANQFIELVKGVELKDSPTLPEEQYGRKLCKNLEAMFQHDWGNVLRAVVKANYPLSRFIDRRSVEIAGFTSKIDDVDMAAPSEPKKEYFTSCANVEKSAYTKAKAAERQGATSRTTRDLSIAEELADEAALREIDDKYEEEYVVLYRKFMREHEVYKSQQVAKKNLKAQLERTVVLSTVVEGLRAAANSITMKLKSAAGLHERVKQKLSSRVVLMNTGEIIDNPLENNNLSGMMQTLTTLYFTATLVHFNADLQRTLSASISKEDVTRNPMKAVTLVERNIATWTTMNYWAFMTPDIFWTNMLLRAMPVSEFQAKCVEHVVSYITEKDSGDGKDEKSVKSVRNSKSMPVYNDLRDFIQRQEDSGRHKPAVVHNPTPTSTGPNPSSQFAAAGNRRGNVEHAHAAVTELFTTTVGREKEIKCKDVTNGKEFPYTATVEVCASCLAKSEHCHKPKCYFGACSKCNLFGHKSYQCRQDPSSYQKKN